MDFKVGVHVHEDSPNIIP